MGVLSGLINANEYILVDGPSRFDLGAKPVLDIADDILLVLNLVVPCVRNVMRMLDGMRQAGFNVDRVKLICNRMGRDSNSLSIEDVRETLNLPVYAALPEEWATMSGSVNLGDPLASYAPKARLRLAIRDLAQRLHHGDSEADERDNGRKGGLFSKIFSDA